MNAAPTFRGHVPFPRFYWSGSWLLLLGLNYSTIGHLTSFVGLNGLALWMSCSQRVQRVEVIWRVTMPQKKSAAPRLGQVDVEIVDDALTTEPAANQGEQLRSGHWLDRVWGIRGQWRDSHFPWWLGRLGRLSVSKLCHVIAILRKMKFSQS